jgi:prepilin-type N-terminal cleavage/methylation domain-containing protein
MRAGTRKASSSGFTLLEVMIAIGILAIGIGAILVSENNSLEVTFRAKQMTTVAMLARNNLVETEREIQGKTFDETKTESFGKFDPPFAEYSWERKIKKITFPNLLKPDSGDDGGIASSNAEAERVVKIATNYLSKATREMVITIKWKEKGKDQQFNVSQYWVDLNHEFNMSTD